MHSIKRIKNNFVQTNILLLRPASNVCALTVVICAICQSEKWLRTVRVRNTIIRYSNVSYWNEFELKWLHELDCISQQMHAMNYGKSKHSSLTHWYDKHRSFNWTLLTITRNVCRLHVCIDSCVCKAQLFTRSANCMYLNFYLDWICAACAVNEALHVSVCPSRVCVCVSVGIAVWVDVSSSLA